MTCLALIVSALLICTSVFGDPVGTNQSRDVERRMEELEGRDRHQQTELDELRQQNLAVLEEVKRLIERDKQQTHRIAVLEEREHACIQRESQYETIRKQNDVIQTEVDILKKRDVMHAGRVEVLERRVQTLTQTVAVLIGSSQGGEAKHHHKGDIEAVQPLAVDVEDNGDVVKSQSGSETAIGGTGKTDVHFGTPFGRDEDDANLGAEQPTKGHSREVRQFEEGMPVAFFATLTNHTYHLGHNQAIAFDHAITNVGNGYHTASGVFFAPVSGIYVFSVTIFESQQTGHFEYAVNGKFMSRMYTDGRSAYETTSQSAIFILSQGDEVVVRSVDTDIWLHADHYNSFSGFLLSNIDPAQLVG